MYRCHQNYFLLSLENIKLLTMPTFFFFPQSSLEHYESGKKESNFSSSYRRNSLAGPSPEVSASPWLPSSFLLIAPSISRES